MEKKLSCTKYFPTSKKRFHQKLSLPLLNNQIKKDQIRKNIRQEDSYFMISLKEYLKYAERK